MEATKHKFYVQRDKFDDVICVTEVLGVYNSWVTAKNHIVGFEGETRYPLHFFDNPQDELSIVEPVESLSQLLLQGPERTR